MARNDPQLTRLMEAFLAERAPEDPFPPARAPLVQYLADGPLARQAAQRVIQRFRDLMARRIVRIEEEDLFQEARLALIGMVDDYNPSLGKPFEQCARFRMFQKLFGLVRDSVPGGREALASVERRIRELSFDDPVFSAAHDHATITRHEMVPGDEDSPHEAFQKHEVLDALARVPDPQRTAMDLVVVQQHSLRDAAKLMGCAHSTVSAYVREGAEYLRHHLPHYADGIDEDA